MPDTKITALAAITTVDPAADVLPIVDISDTSMAASGTTKKITTNQLLGASGTATLASATISGDLTVRTNKLAVTSTGVGVGTATPSAALDVNGASNLNGNVTIANTGSPFGTLFVTGSALELQANSNATNGLSLKTTSTTPIIFSVNSSEAMRLNSTGLGVGVASPAFKLQVVGTSGSLVDLCGSAVAGLQTLVRIRTATANTNGLLIQGNVSNDEMYINNFYNAALSFGTANTERLRIDSTGNVGIGVTPAVKFDSLVADAAESARFRAASGWLRIHPYLDATDVCRLQSVNNTNTGLQNLTIEGLNLRFNTNSGNAVIIDNLGNTVSNVNSAVPALGTNNRMVFNLTSNTNLRISVRGSDGVTRTTNLTLA